MRVVAGLVAKERDGAFFGVKRCFDEWRIPYSVLPDIDGTCPLLVLPCAGRGVSKESQAQHLKNGGRELIDGYTRDRLGLGAEAAIPLAQLELRMPAMTGAWPQGAKLQLSCPALLFRQKSQVESDPSIHYRGRSYRGMLRDGGRLLFPFPLGQLIVDWTGERYERKSEPSVPVKWGLKLYSNLPASVQRLSYKRVRQLRKVLASRRRRHTLWPLDPTVDALMALFEAAIVRLFLDCFGIFPRLGRWPYPHSSAMVMSHDVDKEPAEEVGRLIEIEGRAGIRSTWNFVAAGPEYPLDGGLLRQITGEGCEVGCHGLNHDRLFGSIGGEERRARLAEAKRLLETALGREVSGFRAPLLDRTDDLWVLLEETGYSYDSTYPDVDHLSLTRFGMGVSTSVPYRPVVEDGGWRELNLVELPVSAPQDVELLVDRGFSDEEALALWLKKGDDVAARGGLMVYLTHPHLFREEPRLAMYQSWQECLGRRKDAWKATAGEVARWWQRRRNVQMEVERRGERIRVTLDNKGRDAIHGLSLEVLTPEDACIEGGALIGPQGEGYRTFVIPIAPIGGKDSASFELRLENRGNVAYGSSEE